MSDLLYKDETFKLIELCMEIHRELGKGHDEVLEWKRVVLSKRKPEPPADFRL